ncbi:GNAT family N-acetyltransferase [Afifella sp. IM 167]|uniref:GNAT family N-acetyltransferase n=1 Tax=Afifella sp. IM 167 TaxID=2033586 RepID=UPI001CCCCC68|nr:GNAT family N-acetyltransferase [Afifella sp. IM 167]MBZ8135231.1 GNAT family N-acetyltransferase [Afifella sp. IM 167]
MSRLQSERLILRPWEERDRDFWADLNADPEVMRFFEATRDRRESDIVFERLREHFARNGFGFWVLEKKEDGTQIGFTGLHVADFPAQFTPAIEIGWRLKRQEWKKGYASEAALASLAHAFGPMGLEEVVSFAVEGNEASFAVMRRIGMRRRPDLDFDHPYLPAHSPLRRHLTYAITAAQWQESEAPTGA